MPAIAEPSSFPALDNANIDHGLYRFSRERYYQAIETNVIKEGDKVELIGGLLVTEGMTDRMGQKARHAFVVQRLRKLLGQIFTTGFDVRQQVPISLLNNSDPEPDISVVKGLDSDYLDQHPKNAVLVAEASDSSLSFDQTVKGSLYAAAQIPEYWIVNLPSRIVEVYREPVEDADQPFGYRYAEIRRAKPGESIETLAVPGMPILVDDLLP